MSGDITRYFDLHCDTPYECFVKKQDFNKNSLAVSGEQGCIFEKWKQCFAIWIRDDAPSPYVLYRNIYTDFAVKISCRPTGLTPIMTVEGGSVIEDKPERLELLAKDGIKALTLTWNGKNLIAGGADTDACLTDYGREVIKELNRLKIACDLSHLNEKSFYQTLEVAEYPIVTHACCRALTEHRRNLTDDQIRELVRCGGVMGICFYPTFVGDDAFEGIYRNIYHLCEMGFEDNISIGSDFDGAEMSAQLDKIEKIPELYAFLSRKGIENCLLHKIFYDNAEKIFVSL